MTTGAHPIETATNFVDYGVCQVGHQFYLFKDKESGDIRVLYKRKRG
jgi:Sigma 54 modulation/S30EA ribosomal protein C terminus